MQEQIEYVTGARIDIVDDTTVKKDKLSIVKKARIFTRPFLPFFKRNTMIHVFNYRDKNYIYDVGSGSLHECDKPTADYLKAKEEGADIDITYITDEQIKEILSDIDELKTQGLLYKDEVKAYPVKSNEVKALCIHICHDCNLRCELYACY